MIAGLDYNTDIRVGVVRLLYRCLVELQSHVNRLQLNCLKCFSLIEGFCGNVGLYTVVDCIVVDNLIPQCVMVSLCDSKFTFTCTFGSFVELMSS